MISAASSDVISTAHNTEPAPSSWVAAAVKYNVEFTGLAAETDCVRVDYTDRTTGAVESVRARYVLGCDGATSLVRGSIEATMRDMKFEQRWLVVDVAVTRPVPLPDVGIGVCDPTRAGIYIRIGKSRYRWEFRLSDGESDEDNRDNRRRLLALMAPWTTGVPVDALEFVRVAEYIFRAQVADRWRKDRVFILGDAARLTPPFLGQGMCAGLRDAANLAWKLAGVLTGDLPEPVLDTYEVERKPHAQAMIRRGKVIGMALTEGGELGNILRRLIMPHLHRLPGVADMATDSETPPLHRSGMVVRRPRPLPDLAGRLVPNVLVDDDLRFDDVAGGRFAIITVTEPTPAQRQQIERRGAVIVIACAAGELHRWLRRGRTRAVLVRPDGTVGRTGRALTVLVEALPPFGSHRALPTRLTNTVTIPHSGPHRPSGSAG